MFKLSKKTEYGILALQHMAGAEAGRVSTVKEMSEAFNISQPLLAKICQQLVKNNIIASVQGSRGDRGADSPGRVQSRRAHLRSQRHVHLENWTGFH